MRGLWAAAGLICVALGAIGLFLPFLPTVPFLLAAAFFFGKSSDRLHHWLLAHPVLGPPIRNWNEHGAISPKAKILATFSVGAALAVSLFLGFPLKVILIQAVALIGVMIFIWTRPGR
ncbi:MAG: YbaN family protein [Rhodobacteraceae bacterium]|nr:YbaN family protein [Paracoccaceae bacterium]